MVFVETIIISVMVYIVSFQQFLSYIVESRKFKQKQNLTFVKLPHKT